MSNILLSPFPTKENSAFFRYQDQVRTENEDDKYIFQHPRGEPLRRNVTSQLFKVQKTQDHFAQLRRSKAYIGDIFFPPVSLKNGNLIELFENNQAWKEDSESNVFIDWRDSLIDVIPKLQHDALIELGLFLSFET